MGSFAMPDLAELHAQLAADAVPGSPIQPIIDELVKVVLAQYPYLDATYALKVVVAAMLTTLGMTERLTLPMLDPVNLTKQDALPYLFWGLLYDGWEPDPASGTTVFVTGLDRRSVPSPTYPNPPGNLRKRIYATATTPDLMPIYSQKIGPFFKSLLSPANANQPLMQKYLDSYFTDLYWNLHLGLTGSDVPAFAVQIGQAFNTVLAYTTPTFQNVYDAYLQVRALRPQLVQWLDGEVARLIQSPDPTTIVHYWLKNSDDGKDPNFLIKDITFECFHDFVALSQWGNTLYQTMQLFTSDPGLSAKFELAMTATGGAADPFSALDAFIMELFRTINPNGASISQFTPPGVTNSPFEQYTYSFTSHADTDHYDLHWSDPNGFNPSRYGLAPVAAQNDEARSAEIGFAQCPFDREHLSVPDGRPIDLTNSIFGTVYPVVNGTPTPICDYAGYAPFGFGYRRCPGELLNIQVMRDLLTIVWNAKLTFTKLSIKDPKMVPVGPLLVVPDVYGFTAQ
jgi:hypothetical protein